MRARLLGAWVQSFPVALDTGLLKILDARAFPMWPKGVAELGEGRKDAITTAFLERYL